MKGNSYKSSSSFGDEWEKQFISMLEAENIPYNKEITLSYSKQRKRGVGCDIEIACDPAIYIELKTLQDHQTLAFNNYNNPRLKKNSLKYHQITQMDYLVIKVRATKKLKTDKYIRIKKTDFVLWAASVKKKSINIKEMIKIGTEFVDCGWLNDIK